jgi:hypothetical protein
LDKKFKNAVSLLNLFQIYFVMHYTKSDQNVFVKFHTSALVLASIPTPAVGGPAAAAVVHGLRASQTSRIVLLTCAIWQPKLKRHTLTLVASYDIRHALIVQSKLISACMSA